MCDYSLEAVKSRPATVGDKLVVSTFTGGYSKGLAAPSDPETAVCLLPGTEVAFNDGRVARFRQVNVGISYAHHDTLEFADGDTKLIAAMNVGESLTVLQLPAQKKPAIQKIEDHDDARDIEQV